jgi:DNA-binding XRE family transcriptional regulator
MNTARQERLYLELGKNIRMYRLAAKLSQTSLASRINLSRTSVVNIEQGRQHASLHLLWQIAESLDVKIHDLIPDKLETRATQTLDVQSVKTVVNEEAYQRVSTFISHQVLKQKKKP